MRLRPLAIFVTCTLISASNAQSSGQSAPKISEAIASTSGPMSAEGKTAISQFVQYWSTELDSDSPQEIRMARVELARPLNGLRVTDVFRLEYSTALVPVLSNMTKNGSLIQAVNAVGVLRALGTEQAMVALRESASKRMQPRVQIRIASAGALATIAASVRLTQAKADPITRSIGEDAASETDWMALYGDLSALSTLSSNPNIPAGSQEEAFRGLIRALDMATERAAKGGASAVLMQAVWRSLGDLRDAVAKTPSAKLPILANQVRILLPKIVMAAQNCPAAEAETQLSFKGASAIAETLMRRLPAPTKYEVGDDSKLKNAWVTSAPKPVAKADGRPNSASALGR
ncbi:MAG: hypothetical protein EXS00_05820 [Phycisphaerales bacterium]|nr:hypothetical protein [Phycisphaerales bacterium]